MRHTVPGWDPRSERDACGIGFVADAKGSASREIVDLALDALCRVRHRGAIAADERTGDGAGILLPIPGRLLASSLEARGHSGADPDWLGVAMVFLGTEDDREVRGIVELACRFEAIDVVAWREVTVDPSALGEYARRTMPRIVQAILLRPAGPSKVEAERRCHRARKRAESAVRKAGLGAYFPSFSFRTVTYKGLVAADQLSDFYPDLTDSATEAPFAIFHQRYSTNTAPSWERAQPFRLLCHNGEINTIQGNVNRMRAREGRLGKRDLLEEEVLRPIIDESGSDSAMLDNVVQLLSLEGENEGEARDIRHVVAMLMPAAWEGAPDLDESVRDFYRYHASLFEPWDGPAGIVFTDGLRVGAALDRNGLRPLRYAVCEDGLVACSSEAGAVSVRGRGRVRRGKLGPGGMIFVDPRAGGFQDDPLGGIARSRPYGAWLAEYRMSGSAGEPGVEVPDHLIRLQVAHGITREELNLVLRPMASQGKEPTFSMGDDTPAAVMSQHRRPIYSYLKQRFAQVTNPAIDHLRERSVMSLRTLLGPHDPILWERPEGAALLEFDTFLLFRSPGGARLDASFPVEDGTAGLREACVRMASAGVEAARHGGGILIVTDQGADKDRAPVPSLLAVGAVHQALLRAGHRTRTSIVVETDDARESHHFACLLGYGAEAVVPRLALATIAQLVLSGRARGGASVEDALLRYRSAAEEGVLKILSKMGISCVDSYRGAQIFDALGLGADVIDVCFTGTPAPLGGIGFEDIAEDVIARHAAAFGEQAPALDNPGVVKFHKGGEYHATHPGVVRALHRVVDPSGVALRTTQAGDDDEETGEIAEAGEAPNLATAHALQRAVAEGGTTQDYQRFAELVRGRPTTAVRDLLEVRPAGIAVPLDEVEPVESITRRFSTGAISHGSIGREAHETLAIAMNSIGGKSNTGEGGEDPARYRTRGQAVDRNSRIKQVASGRFGVTPEYLAFADELQIKIAQGSKPGEGGQLPGHKVTPEIARLRHTQPGVALISPPPHHDIYSIEDLAQLIFDLKQANPDVDVSVKLVAEAGVGQIAAGVVKGLADVVHISGADGGTGASPLSSIKNAGLPWEIGLAETQATLVANGLRDRVRIRIDGGLKTGRDALIAALLGADEYSFGTAALVAEGCIMVRSCHLDTCPTGIATQREDLRAKFAGTPDMVARYMTHVAEEIRQMLSRIGLRSLGEAVGRADLLTRGSTASGRAATLDVGPLLDSPGRTPQGFVASNPIQRPRSALGDRVFEDAIAAILEGHRVELRYEIGNADRTIGARLGSAVARAFGAAKPPGSARIAFAGEAGQSFGAFLSDGVEFVLSGEANDYVAKGMGGGLIVIVPPEDDAGDPVLCGNTVLYGATGGELFVAGRAGERFAVRNSGAIGVVEGVGDHGCEYMTGGCVVVLGPAGANFGAGMTGGEAFVFDPASGLPARVNPELVETRRCTRDELSRVQSLTERHAALTGSVKAGALLADWDLIAAGAFWRVAPKVEVAAISAKNEGTLKSARA